MNWTAAKSRHLASGDEDRWFPLRLWFHVLLVLGLAGVAPFLLWEFFSGKFASPLGDELKVDVARLILYVIAGIGGVVALVITYRRQRLGEAADVREHMKAFNERFASAADQLSSDKAANRLAGVYAMASLADDWDEDRQTCINVLCAYMRMPYDPPEESPELDSGEARKEHQERRSEQQVRRTIMDVIGERLRAEPRKGKTWHGHDFDLSGAVLDGGNLNGIRVIDGLLNLSRAVFSGGRVEFSGAEFSGGQVDFHGAVYSGGRVDFDGAVFSGGQVSFGAKFSGGQVSFGGARFSGSGVDFADAVFSGCRVGFGRARFSGGRVDFGGARFSGGRVDFADAVFSGGRVDFGSPREWTIPPQFDAFPYGPPEGLLLPAPAPEPGSGSRGGDASPN